MNCSPPADFAVVGGKKLAFDGYELKLEKLRVVVQSGINKSSGKGLEESFTVGHLLGREALINVTDAIIEAKGKQFKGQILSTVFSEKSKYKDEMGTMRIKWEFDEATETLFSEGFTLTFKVKLDGKDEEAQVKFEPIRR